MHYRLENIIDDYDEIERLFKIASQDNHRNSKNYIDIEKRYSKYIAFHAIYDDDGPLSFSGMYHGWKDIVRILDRFYIFDRLRKKSINSANRKIKPAGTYFIPEQTKIAEQMNLIPFFSVQELKRRGSIQLIIDGIDGHHNYRLLDNMYWTCHTPIDTKECCWQSVGSIVDELPLPNLEVEKIKLVFQ